MEKRPVDRSACLLGPVGFGAMVTSAQAVITVPAVSSPLQSELLSQTLAGLQSALEPQEPL